MSGFIVYFNLDVSPGQQLSTATDKAGEKCSWAVRGWLSGAPVQVKKGDRFNVRYSYRVESSDTKVEISPA
jgi:hypothetical protein